MSVLLDTSVLYGFLHREDVRHRDAVALVRRIATGELGVPLTTDYVADELFTLIRARTRSATLERAARRLLPLPEPALPGLRMLTVAPQHFESALTAFETHRAKRISFTDATLLAVMEAHRVGWLATYDEGLAKLAPTVPDG